MTRCTGNGVDGRGGQVRACRHAPRDRPPHHPSLVARRGRAPARHPEPHRGREVARRRRAGPHEGSRRGARPHRPLPRAQRDAAARLLGRRGPRDRGRRRLRHPADPAERRRRRGRGGLAPAPRLVGSRLRDGGCDRGDPARVRRRAARGLRPDPHDERTVAGRVPPPRARRPRGHGEVVRGASRASTGPPRSAGPTAPRYAVGPFSRRRAPAGDGRRRARRGG